jgi:hypothetical protein
VNRHKAVNDFWKKLIYSDEYKVELGLDNRVLIRMESTMVKSRSWCSCKFDDLGLNHQ